VPVCTCMVYFLPSVPPDTLNCTASPMGTDRPLMVRIAVFTAILEKVSSAGEALPLSVITGVPVSSSPLSSLPENEIATFLTSDTVLVFI